MSAGGILLVPAAHQGHFEQPTLWHLSASGVITGLHIISRRLLPEKDMIVSILCLAGRPCPSPDPDSQALMTGYCRQV